MLPDSCTSSAISSSTSRGGRRVELAGRLDGDQELRPGGDRRAERDPLLLAAGQLTRMRVTPGSEADAFEQLVRPGVTPRRRLAREAELDPDELARGQLAREGAPVMLVGVAEPAGAEASGRPATERPDVDAGDANRARRRAVETGHDPEQRRLAGAARAEDDAELAPLDRKAEALQRGDAPVRRGVARRGPGPGRARSFHPSARAGRRSGERPPCRGRTSPLGGNT